MKMVFDIETDGLFPKVSTVHIMVMKNIDSGERIIFSPEERDSDVSRRSIQAAVDKAEVLIGHNIVMYDAPVLERILGIDFSNVKLIDTMILSQVLNYVRFGGKHSLKAFSDNLGGFPGKVAHEDWSRYSREMRRRCISDVDLNEKVFHHLVKELDAVPKAWSPRLRKTLRFEHSYSQFCAFTSSHGWSFNLEKAKETRDRLQKEVDDITEQLAPLMERKLKGIDSEPLTPKWTKTGDYSRVTTNWFGIDSSRGQIDRDRPLQAPYMRFKIENSNLGSSQDQKKMLVAQGWKPEEWNYTRVNGKLKRTSPRSRRIP